MHAVNGSQWFQRMQTCRYESQQTRSTMAKGTIILMQLAPHFLRGVFRDSG